MGGFRVHVAKYLALLLAISVWEMHAQGQGPDVYTDLQIQGPDTIDCGLSGKSYSFSAQDKWNGSPEDVSNDASTSWSMSRDDFCGASMSYGFLNTQNASGTPGPVTLMVSAHGLTATKTVTVNTVGSLSISGPNTIDCGLSSKSFGFFANALVDGSTADISSEASTSWSLSRNDFCGASLSYGSLSTQNVSGAPGPVTLTVSAYGLTATKTVTVNTVGSLSISGPNTIDCGLSSKSFGFFANATVDGSSADISSDASTSWSLSRNDFCGASMSYGSLSTQNVSGTPGPVTLTVSAYGLTATKTVTVNTVGSLSISGPDSINCESMSKSFSFLANAMVDGSAADLTSDASTSWSLSRNDFCGASLSYGMLGTQNDTGNPGSVTLTANAYGLTATKVVNVLINADPPPFNQPAMNTRLPAPCGAYSVWDQPTQGSGLGQVLFESVNPNLYYIHVYMGSGNQYVSFLVTTKVEGLSATEAGYALTTDLQEEYETCAQYAVEMSGACRGGTPTFTKAPTRGPVSEADAPYTWKALSISNGNSAEYTCSAPPP